MTEENADFSPFSPCLSAYLFRYSSALSPVRVRLSVSLRGRRRSAQQVSARAALMAEASAPSRAEFETLKQEVSVLRDQLREQKEAARLAPPAAQATVLGCSKLSSTSSSWLLARQARPELDADAAVHVVLLLMLLALVKPFSQPPSNETRLCACSSLKARSCRFHSNTGQYCIMLRHGAATRRTQ